MTRQQRDLDEDVAFRGMSWSEIKQAFSEIRSHLNKLESGVQSCFNKSSFDYVEERRWLSEMDDARERLFHLSAAVSSKKSNNVAELAIKAAVLIDLTADERGDVVSTLASSLCKDIMNMTSQGRN